MNGFKLFVATFFACVFVLGLGGMANGTVMDSSAFAWKYEFEGATANTPDNLDIDGNGHPDMMLFGSAGPGTVASGVMTLSSYDDTDPVYGTSYMDDFGWKPELTDGIWKSHDFSAGFTIEARVKVLLPAGRTEGVYGSTSIAGAGSDLGTANDAWLNIGANKLWWASGTPSQIGSDADNTDGFHRFRLAVDDSTGNISVWRDGVLQAENLPDLYAGAGYKRLYLGDISGRTAGTVEFDYVRFTAGAFTPVPEPGTVLLLAVGLIGLLAYAWRKRR